MTVVVTFLCTDGVVVAADSMLTSSMGGLPVAHHTGKKVFALEGRKVFAFAGDHGLGARFRIEADTPHAGAHAMDRAIDYPLMLAERMIGQFCQTGIGDTMNLNTVLAYEHGGVHQCCIFEGRIQPRLLDRNHFYGSLGSGILSADPFLRFLVDVFCRNGPPNVREGVFLAAWAIDHVIRTNPGGVAGPIRVATLERARKGEFAARELREAEIDEHRRVIDDACDSLHDWMHGIQTGATTWDAPPLPEFDDG